MIDHIDVILSQFEAGERDDWHTLLNMQILGLVSEAQVHAIMSKVQVTAAIGHIVAGRWQRLEAR